jgi:hypothetical protein
MLKLEKDKLNKRGDFLQGHIKGEEERVSKEIAVT